MQKIGNKIQLNNPTKFNLKKQFKINKPKHKQKLNKNLMKIYVLTAFNKEIKKKKSRARTITIKKPRIK